MLKQIVWNNAFTASLSSHFSKLVQFQKQFQVFFWSIMFPLSELQAALAASLGSLVVGFTSAWASPAIASLQKEGSR